MKQQRFDNQIYHAALYCRLSKDDEDKSGDSSSIKTQKSMLESYCREQEFLVHDFYVDDGYSGLNFDRPDFQRLLTDIDNKNVNMVITKDLSRLGRDYIQTGYYTEIYFSKKNIRYIAVNDGYDSDRGDNDIALFRHILNDMYAKDLSRKVKSAKRQRALNGYFISSQAPYGYKPNPQNPNQLVVDTEAAEIVKRIFVLSLSGYSANEIAKNLSRKGIITPRAYKYLNGDTRFARYLDRGETRWCFETVQLILKDRVYMGDMENHKAEVANYKTKQMVSVPKSEHIIVEDTHESLVSREDFKKVQQLVKARHKKPHNNFENIFRGLLYCSHCGCKLCMGTKAKNGKHYHHYRCNQHYLYPEKCPKPHQITYGNLYNAVLERIQALAKTMQSDEKFHELVRKKVQSNTQSKRRNEDKVKAEKRLSELSAKVRKLFDDYEKGILTSQNYEMLMSETQKEQADLTAKLQEFQKELSNQADQEGQLENLREAVKECLDIKELTPFVLNKLVDRIEVGSQNLVDGIRRQEITVVWRFVGGLEYGSRDIPEPL